ncbi:EAL-associated domain-containing protein [Chryseomicrobium palamuruense]|uniref:EAL-associated domain-containing protein n=1 Tax=Chryseomicrobium palamuruense TaxID=682973 RepID=A0ABV8UVT4_9BACL
MDALKIMDQLDQLRPALQPIVSAITHQIVGYEVLGRFATEDGVISLGPFFNDPEIPEDFKNEIDGHLLNLAVDHMLEQKLPGYLSINRSGAQLLADDGEVLLQQLEKQEKKGFRMDRFVLEVTEHDIAGDFENLSHLLRYYKTYGLQLAIDHIGGESSNIDRIRTLQPHILKINASLTRSSNLENFQDVLHTLSVLARRIGAVLAYEHIEDVNQLYFAWKNNGHYYQGYYLGKPSCTLTSNQALAIPITEQIHEFVEREKQLIQQRLAFAEACGMRLKKLRKWQSEERADALLHDAQGLFDEEAFRLYICDSNGRQVSSNLRRHGEAWSLEEDIRGANWAFRPYFLETMLQMQLTHKGRLSDLYSDIETREFIRTFSYPLTNDYFLFIDISSSFLTERDYLFMN